MKTVTGGMQIAVILNKSLFHSVQWIQDLQKVMEPNNQGRWQLHKSYPNSKYDWVLIVGWKLPGYRLSASQNQK